MSNRDQRTAPKIVASSEVNRLPTLKELIGYRTNNYDNPSPVFLSLFPLKPKDEEILSRENAISNDTQPWTRKQEKTYDALSKHLDLSADAVNAYYVEDNAADEEDDSSLTNKKRIDRQDSSTTTLKPTTMRGIPLINLLQSKPPRGFYVTRSETTVSAVQQVESEGVTTETTIVLPTEDDQNGSSTVASETEPSQTERHNTEESTETSTEFGVALNSSLHANSGEIEAKVEGTTSMDEEQTQSLTTGETITDTSTSEENVTASPSIVSPINSTPAIFASPFPIESETSTIPESVDSAAKEIAVNDNATLSVSNADSTLISTVTEAELRSEDETSTAYYPAADRNVTDKESKSGESSSRATISSTLAAGLTEPAVTERNNKGRKNKVTRGRPKVEFDSGYGYEFGRKSEGRRRVGLRVTPKIAEGEDAKTETDKTQQTRRRVAVYRGRRRKPAATTTPLNSIVYQTTRANNREVAEESAQESEQRTTTVSLGKTATEREMNESEGSAEEKKVARKSNEARNEADSKEEDRLRIEENVDRFETEVNTSKSTVTSRNPGNLPSTRLRKPTTLASTAPQNKTANTLANHRKTHPGDGNFTLVNEKPDAADEITETRKAEKDIDQSSRAQEIAVTLAEAPSSRTSATGRPPLRNALRRKISTTIAPRTDPTTSRTTVRFTPPVRSRQRPKAKDKAVQNATTRPRRPPVVDYDYYEDEEEPVVGKSSFNGKLFLTSKGNIRCLDQGNFPHPYSCKKFITCAKMVNGLVIGAEYTCPDKLSYDPVGGICNWSAGLGCKE